MKRLLTSVVLATALISTETSAKTDWWGVASDVLELTSTVMNSKAPVASGGTRSHRAKSYVTSYEYEQAPALYSDWIKVDRKRHSFSPEFFDQFCSFPMRAGLIEYAHNGKECPKFIMVHPSEFY